jgi:hypothetical protein
MILLCTCAALGCRIEREPATDPLAQAEDAGIDAFGSPVSASQTEDDGASDGAAGSAATPAADDAAAGDDGERADAGSASPADARAGADAASDGAGDGDGYRDDTTPDASSEPAGGGACVELTIANCNPITNTGCAAELMMQCAVDVLAAVPSGYCTFSSPPMPGQPCLNIGLTESCPPTTTCVAGECRPLCFCDDQCDQGQCCVEPIGTQGFKVCGDC